MSGPRILIVEDNETIGRLVELELRHAGFEPTWVLDGAAALERFKSEQPDLVILDLMLPGMDGLDVARALRADSESIPILMLTARAETHDVVSGFDAGADDYLRKPFEIAELTSRIRALLKRSTRVAEESKVAASGVEIDPDQRLATMHGKSLDLTAKEYDLLYYLVKNAGRVVPRDEILSRVWGGQHATDSNVIEVFVCHLRNKIGDRDNRVIQTIRGVGYFFARG